MKQAKVLVSKELVKLQVGAQIAIIYRFQNGRMHFVARIVLLYLVISFKLKIKKSI